jgi:hypothetical protein
MRGKLRDKRTQNKRDSFKREMIERRRTPRRENRTMAWLNQQLEEENYGDYSVADEPEVLVEAAAKPLRK